MSFSFLFLTLFLIFFFICRRWPTLLSCTPRRPHNSTSETCSCNVRSAFAAECCGPSRSTDSHSCPCRDWSCCRSGPACPMSPNSGPARKNLATFRSTPALCCLPAAGAWGGCDCDAGVDCGGCYYYGWSDPAVRCSGCEPWWAWRRGSALLEWSPRLGTPEWPANRSSAGSSPMSRGTCTSFSCCR